MNIKLTNGKKTITRTKEQYEANINHFIKRGFCCESCEGHYNKYLRR
jgi:flagellar biosynthesis chaperone FliJ